MNFILGMITGYILCIFVTEICNDIARMRAHKNALVASAPGEDGSASEGE